MSDTIQYPGVEGKPFKILIATDGFKKGDILLDNASIKIEVLSDPKPHFSWWRRFIVWLLRDNKKLKAMLANGYIYTVKTQYANHH